MLLCIFAIGFLYMNLGWFLTLTLYQLTGLPVPPASAWYRVQVANKTSTELLVTVELINDRPFGVFTPLEEFQRRMVGRTTSGTVIVQACSSQMIELPSPEYARLGIVLVSAISRMRYPGSPNAQQEVAMIAVRWNEGRLPNSNIIPVIISNENLFSVDVNSLQNLAGQDIELQWKVKERVCGDYLGTSESTGVRP